ncbi:MAG: aminotransferase class I/II-fold pyridoxal phosphate-dependent enzyme [Crocinitomicaceae bacterium]
MNKIEDLPVSASMEVSKLAKQLTTEGKDIVNMSVGDIHFPISEFLKSKIIEGCEHGHTHYDKAMGMDVLRNAVASEYQVKSDQVFVSNGVKNVLYSFMMTQFDKKACVLEPAWLGYKGICHLTNTHYIPLNYFHKDWIENLNNTEFDLLLVCSPNNPDGKVYTEQEVDAIMEAAKKQNALVLLDEIYKDFIYEGAHYFTKYYGDKNLIILNGFSKSQAVTGLRVGYGIFHDTELINLMNRIQQNTFTCPNTISQYALSFYQQNNESVKKYKAYYHENRDLILKEIPELSQFLPNGGFYFFFQPIVFGFKEDAQTFCKNLLNHAGLAMIPGEAYGVGLENYVRMSFCLDREELAKGIRKFKAYIENYEKD